MQNFRLGDYVRQKRLDQGLTQEEVCDGICEPITLSRLENNKQTPSRNRINAILQRLGLPDDRYYSLLTQNELEIEALKKEIVACNVQGQLNKGFEKIKKLEEISSTDDHPTQQFILRSKILLGRLDARYSNEEQLTMLMEAISITVPKFDLDEIDSRLYTIDEIKIINQIAIAYSNLENNKKAADIYYQLLRYTRKHAQEILTSNPVMPLILYNYARVLDLSSRYSEGVEIAQKGLQCCIEIGHYQLFPGCLAIYAECCHFLGRNTESFKSYRQAYYLFEALGKTHNQHIIAQEVKAYFGICLEDQLTSYSGSVASSGIAEGSGVRYIFPLSPDIE